METNFADGLMMHEAKVATMYNTSELQFVLCGMVAKANESRRRRLDECGYAFITDEQIQKWDDERAEKAERLAARFKKRG